MAKKQPMVDHLEEAIAVESRHRAKFMKAAGRVNRLVSAHRAIAAELDRDATMLSTDQRKTLASANGILTELLVRARQFREQMGDTWKLAVADRHYAEAQVEIDSITELSENSSLLKDRQAAYDDVSMSMAALRQEVPSE